MGKNNLCPPPLSSLSTNPMTFIIFDQYHCFPSLPLFDLILYWLQEQTNYTSIKNGNSLHAGNVYLLPMADGKKKSPSCSVKLSLCSLKHLVCFVCSLLHRVFVILYSSWIFSSLSSRKVDMFVINKHSKSNMYVIRIQSSESGPPKRHFCSLQTAIRG